MDLGDPVREEQQCHLGVPSSTPAFLGQIVFLPLPNAPPTKAVTPRRVERKPRLPDQKISRDPSIPAPLLPEAGHRGVRFDGVQPPPARKH